MLSKLHETLLYGNCFPSYCAPTCSFIPWSMVVLDVATDSGTLHVITNLRTLELDDLLIAARGNRVALIGHLLLGRPGDVVHDLLHSAARWHAHHQGSP